MNNLFATYIQSISEKFRYKETSEMGYRTDFEILTQAIFESINVKRIDHDPKASKGNKPDFIVMKHDIPILYIEVKDIGVSLDKIEKSEQMARYFGYANLVLADYVEFRFYRNGERYEEPITIAEYNKKNRTITPHPENYEHLAKSLIDFAQTHKEPIKNGLHLAKIMGGKAQRIRDNLLQFLSIDSEKNSEINKIFNTLKKLLVHALKPDAFADMYAQTLVYGLFVARYHDKTPDSFSRQEARELVPASNPFLRHFFDHIVGPDFDKRLEYIVDELCEVFSHANLPQLMKQYFKDDLWGKTNEGPDPVIHFYEDFLREYDPNLRKKLGAYYTPQPVVRFIVRSVDYLLKKEFSLHGGLADTSKTKNGTHKVQILDPAVGTGTFLSAVIRNIYLGLKENGQIGRWPAYVHNDLLPRLHGFEIMMAPYTIAHLKLSMAFKATGFKHFNRRLGIYLTNSLEEADNIGDLFTGFGFAESIAEESKEANQIKTDTPIMVVIGNPPYNVSSSNKGEWITNLIKSYKKDLNERKINLDDDYIKFIRFSEHFVSKNKTGIVAMITNNSFIDGITHRQMRKHLLETFDEIYVLDLHGNSKKKETAPDGSKDENVFDIMQGVSITIMIKKNVKVLKPHQNKFATVKFAELYGKRADKFKMLSENDLDTIKWKELKYKEPYYFFVQKDFKNELEYSKGYKIDDLFSVANSGVKTDRDSLFIDFNKKNLSSRIQKLLSAEYDNNFKQKFRIINSGSYKIIEKLKNRYFDEEFIEITQYRPFDYKWIYYDPSLVSRPGQKVFKHIVAKNNIALLTSRQLSTFDYQHIFIAKNLVDICTVSLQTKETGYALPLYLYSEDGTKTPNLNQEILSEIEKVVGKTEPEEILDYIYAILHSPTYREKYKEFLKIDFPRVPYPKDKTTFKKLVKLGTELRLIHLLESPKVSQFITTFPEMGTDIVEKPRFDSAQHKNNLSRHAEFISASNNNSKKNEIPDQVQNDNKSKNDDPHLDSAQHENTPSRHAEFISASSNSSRKKEIPDQVRNDNQSKNVDPHFDSTQYECGNIWINQEQYFGNVPKIAWNFYIGGYQPAQKWLKDRKGRTLTNEDIEHYQKIIVALTETHRLMQEIDKINFI